MAYEKSILTGEGLYGLITNPRFRAQKEFVERSRCVFHHGNLVGHIYTPEQFKKFVELPFIRNKAVVLRIFEKHSRDLGVGEKVFPIELVDQLLDLCAGVEIEKKK